MPDVRARSFDYLIVVAGFAGSVMAERLAGGLNSAVHSIYVLIFNYSFSCQWPLTHKRELPIKTDKPCGCTCPGGIDVTMTGQKTPDVRETRTPKNNSNKLE